MEELEVNNIGYLEAICILSFRELFDYSMHASNLQTNINLIKYINKNK